MWWVILLLPHASRPYQAPRLFFQQIRLSRLSWYFDPDAFSPPLSHVSDAP